MKKHIKKYIKTLSVLGLGFLVVSPIVFGTAAASAATVSAVKIPAAAIQATTQNQTQTQIQTGTQTSIGTQAQAEIQTQTPQSVTAWGIITAMSGDIATFQTASSGQAQKTFTVNVGSAQIYIDGTLSSSSALGIGMQGTAWGTETSKGGVVTATKVDVHSVRAWGTVTAVNGTTITFQDGNGKTWQVNDSAATIYIGGKAASSSSIAVGMKGYAQGGWNSNTETLLDATIVRLSGAAVSGSSDASLSGLTVSTGTLNPAFASSTMSYTDAVATGTTSMTVTPTATQGSSTITVDGTAVTSGSASGPITLNIGTPTSITIVVTAPNGVTQDTYTIMVNGTQSSDASLSGLTVSTGTLNPAFASSTMSYTDAVASDTTSMTVTPTATQGSSTITVDGTLVTSGSASGPITLNAATSTTISVVVTAPNGVTQDTYSIGVNGTQSSDASLSALTVSSGALNPVFASSTMSYTDAVASDTTSMTVAPTATQTGSTITVNGTAVLSGSASGPITLNAGTSTPITIVVTAPDGVTQETYTIMVSGTQSSDASLSNLTVSTGTLNPTFASSTTSYTDAVASGTISMTVTPTATQTGSTITVNGTVVPSGIASGPINLNIGSSTTISVVVTAPDGVTQDTYSIVATE